MNRPIPRTVLISSALIVALLTTPILAQEESATRRIPTTIESWSAGDTPDVRGLADSLGLAGEEPLALSLDQTITLALQRNLTLVTQRYARSRTLLAIEEALGIYDINLSGTLSHSESTSPRTSSLEEGGTTLTSERQNWDFSANRQLSYGAGVQVDFNNTRTTNSNLTASLSPQFIPTLRIAYQQSLLRNRGREVTERNILVAKTNAAISQEDFQTQVEVIVQQASDGYWNLVEALKQLEVAQESLAQAEELHEMNRIQVEVGTKAPLEMVQSEATVASRREEIIQLRANVDDEADGLRRLINLDRNLNWDRPIQPSTEPVVEFEAVDVNEAVEMALASRPDVRRQKLQNENLELDARVAKNQAKPSLDFSASVSYSGIGGTLRGFDPSTGEVFLIDETDYFDAVSVLSDRDFENIGMSVTFGYPIGNRAARSRVAQAELAVEQGDFELQDLEMQVLSEVRRSVRALRTAAERIESAKVASRLARENLDAEQKRYENGMSTSFQVTEIQEDLSQALSREVSAIINYRRAETNYYRTIGKLLDEYDVELATE